MSLHGRILLSADCGVSIRRVCVRAYPGWSVPALPGDGGKMAIWIGIAIALLAVLAFWAVWAIRRRHAVARPALPTYEHDQACPKCGRGTGRFVDYWIQKGGGRQFATDSLEALYECSEASCGQVFHEKWDLPQTEDQRLPLLYEARSRDTMIQRLAHHRSDVLQRWRGTS